MKHTITKKLHAILLLILASFNLFGQEWEIAGRRAFVGIPSAPLSRTMMGLGSLAQFSFVSEVGGVAFHTKAKPESTFYVAPNLSIDYIRYNSDGSRLRIVNGTDTVFPYIPDWQLLPIIKYADNEYNSCVSLFGPKTDSTHFDIVYHQSFQNTLLGMRMLQADMALMDTKNNSELPKYDNQTITGFGEIAPQPNSGYEAALEIDGILKKYVFASWVLTDDSVSFSIKNNAIEFKGTPYYHFWITNLEADYIKFRKLYSKAVDDDYANNQTALTKDSAQLVAIANKLKNDKEKQKVIPVKGATNELKNKYYLLLELNKPVYSAVLNTSHYAAFFRFIKENKQSTWNGILNEISNAEIKPYIKTPTDLPKEIE